MDGNIPFKTWTVGETAYQAVMLHPVIIYLIICRESKEIVIGIDKAILLPSKSISGL